MIFYYLISVFTTIINRKIILDYSIMDEINCNKNINTLNINNIGDAYLIYCGISKREYKYKKSEKNVWCEYCEGMKNIEENNVHFVMAIPNYVFEGSKFVFMFYYLVSTHISEYNVLICWGNSVKNLKYTSLKPNNSLKYDSIIVLNKPFIFVKKLRVEVRKNGFLNFFKKIFPRVKPYTVICRYEIENISRNGDSINQNVNTSEKQQKNDKKTSKFREDFSLADPRHILQSFKIYTKEKLNFYDEYGIMHRMKYNDDNTIVLTPRYFLHPGFSTSFNISWQCKDIKEMLNNMPFLKSCSKDCKIKFKNGWFENNYEYVGCIENSINDAINQQKIKI
ncbi:hypothetical protein CWI37_2348p0010 [Hamiltosporidium tvaerminnensis]|uniref:Uncharacterized protein n=1 Tax=Hamiltosporidium tvaerminnensis TaxID=1176355 RepID=A0A4Q9KRL8_9MICR|nr:hypothetical protein CWI37_2348p0010 [Hamiltosporidium tvaerminnensis]